ncbi:MAG: hypothetical protein DSY80_06280 [Desulfocapsa sp.]|nr:MAG: hypothetical protein DSY80_06280 [Desulfocapsa sp.]
MSVISAIKTYIETYTGIDSDAPIWVNYLHKEPVEYSIVPLGGSRNVSEWIHGNSGEREFLFAFQSSRFTAEEVDRVGSIEFFESFAQWLDDQSFNDNLPALPSGYTATNIEASGYAYLFEQGNSSTGIYQIQCVLEFTKSR